MAVVVAFPRSGVPAAELLPQRVEKARPGYGEIVILPCIRHERLSEQSCESDKLARQGPVAKFR